MIPQRLRVLFLVALGLGGCSDDDYGHERPVRDLAVQVEDAAPEDLGVPSADARDAAIVPGDAGCGRPNQPCCRFTRCDVAGCCVNGQCVAEGSQCQGGGDLGAWGACTNSACGSCGTLGKPCCPGNQCTSVNALCAGGVCIRCGSYNEQCCPGSACSEVDTECRLGVCLKCGAPGKECCPGRTCAQGDAVCLGANPGTCAKCGAAGEACCDANRCNGDGCCFSGRCVADGEVCGNGGKCGLGSCGGCGKLGQLCCPSALGDGGAGGFCTSAEAACNANGVCVECGDNSQPCCPGAGSGCKGPPKPGNQPMVCLYGLGPPYCGVCGEESVACCPGNYCPRSPKRKCVNLVCQ